jgi:hypothetical protein
MRSGLTDGYGWLVEPTLSPVNIIQATESAKHETVWYRQHWSCHSSSPFEAGRVSGTLKILPTRGRIPPSFHTSSLWCKVPTLIRRIPRSRKEGALPAHQSRMGTVGAQPSARIGSGRKVASSAPTNIRKSYGRGNGRCGANPSSYLFMSAVTSPLAYLNA